MNTSELLKKKDKIEKLKIEKNQAVGELTTYLKRLKDDWGCANIKEAKKMLKENKKELEEKEKLFEKLCEELEDNYDW